MIKFFISFAIMLNSAIVFGQKVAKPVNASGFINCIYLVTYQPDSASKSLQYEYMNLVTNGVVSKFQSEGTRLRDSLINANPQLPTSQASLQILTDKMTGFPKTRFRYAIYKNIGTSKVHYYDNVGTTVYRQDEAVKPFNWKITSATATIAGYPCQKATVTFAGRDYEAWFSRQVPVADGPYKFFGLPGLIIKLFDTRKSYSFELARLKKMTDSVAIVAPAKTAPATMPMLLRGQRDYELTIPDRMAAMGNSMSEAKKQARIERVKKYNNPIELE